MTATAGVFDMTANAFGFDLVYATIGGSALIEGAMIPTAGGQTDPVKGNTDGGTITFTRTVGGQSQSYVGDAEGSGWVGTFTQSDHGGQEFTWSATPKPAS